MTNCQLKDLSRTPSRWIIFCMISSFQHNCTPVLRRLELNLVHEKVRFCMVFYASFQKGGVLREEWLDHHEEGKNFYRGKNIHKQIGHRENLINKCTVASSIWSWSNKQANKQRMSKILWSLCSTMQLQVLDEMYINVVEHNNFQGNLSKDPSSQRALRACLGKLLLNIL